MSDLIYREDAKDFVRQALSEGYDIIKYLDEVPAVDCPASAAAPTVDAVPVVRCKDCTFRKWNGSCMISGVLNNEDFYCADGKRKGGDE